MSASRPEPFELFALRYASHGGRRSAENFIGGDVHEQGSDLDYYLWVARRSDRCFVIDTGFGPEQALARNRPLLRSPAEALALIGVQAEKVDEVILTHLHYDHAGTLDAFPRACFHLQDREAAYATGRCMCQPYLKRPFHVEDVVSFVRHVYAGRVAFHDGVEELADGLSLHRIGGHSAGLQVVRVLTKRGWVVIASDASHLYVNMQRQMPFPILQDAEAMLEGFRTIHRLADSPEHVIPGHDPLVMKLYPPVSPALAGIAVRLDETPAPIP